jgi:uncharacterized protein (DUF736 family)
MTDPDMVLLHGGSPRGAERIAACWAHSRKVAQVVFKPDWTRDRNAAPFKRNDRMLEALQIGVVVFPGSGIAANLADKAKKLGIPTWRFDQPAPGLNRGPSPTAAPYRRRRHPPYSASLAIIPIDKTSDKAPDHRVYAGPRHEVGAGWSQVAKSSGETYINLKIGSPEFGPNWVRCRLVKLEKPAEDGATHIALWEPRD